MNVFVIGAGTMGIGIAQAFLQAEDMKVWLCDVEEHFVQNGVQKIQKGLNKLVSKGKITEEQYNQKIKSLHKTTTLEDAFVADLVIEAIFEDMEEKNVIFQKLDEICSSDTYFVSNTSSLSITEIQSGLRHKEKFCGMHFFNPAPIMKMVEITKGFYTSDETQEKIFEVAVQIGKDPVKVKEGPGFIVNRLLIPMINEACEILREGLATPEDIDKAMKLGAGHTMGPLATADLVGNDINLHIMESLFKETGDPKYRPSILLKQMVRANQLGRKTGKGFFEYPEK